MKRKVLAVLFATALTAGMLSGCGSTDSTSDKADQKEESLEEEIGRVLLYEELHKAIARLPDTQRRRLVLYYFQQLTYEQIAEMEGCRYQSVQESILSAIKKLRKCFK